MTLANAYDKWDNQTCIIDNSGKMATARQDYSTETIAENGISISAFPNPFYSKATFEFSVSESTDATLELYTIAGLKVAT